MVDLLHGGVEDRDVLQDAGQGVNRYGDRDGADQDHAHAAANGFFAVLLSSFSPADGADHAAAHSQAFADGIGNGSDGPGDAHGGQSQVAHFLADEQAVDDGVDAGEGEGDHGRDDVSEIILVKHRHLKID